MADSTPEKESAGQDVSEVETADKDILSEMLTENIEKEFAEKEEPKSLKTMGSPLKTLRFKKKTTPQTKHLHPKLRPARAR